MDKVDKYALRPGCELHGNRTYRIVKKIGQGGFGITYMAVSEIPDGNISHEVSYTIKEFFMEDVCMRQDNGSITATVTSKSNMEECKRDFLKEAERLRDIGFHRGIVPVNEVFSENNTVYYVMEYLGTQNLKQYVAVKGGKLDETEALSMIVKIADALNFLHCKDMTHLDVKPDNVMMLKGRDGLQPVLIDFGLSRHYNRNGDPTCKLGALGCSDGYSPMEQYMGITRFSPEADVYALGATFYFMLTGEKPAKACDINDDIINAHLPNEVSWKFRRSIINSMQKLSDKRTGSIDEFLADLDYKSEEYVTPHTQDYDSERVVTERITSSNPSHHKKVVFISAALTVLVVMVVAVTALWPEKKKIHLEYYKTLDKIEMLVNYNGVGILDSVNKADSLLPTLQAMEEEYDVKKSRYDILKDKIGHLRDSIYALSKDNKEYTEAIPSNKSKKASGENSPASDKKNVNDDNQGTKADASTMGRIDLGYATYSGALKNGKPNGHGTLTFKRSHAVDSNDDSHIAESGDCIEGNFSEGHLTDGKWKKQSGEVETLVLGF